MVFVFDIFHSYGSILYIYLFHSAVSEKTVELYHYWLVRLSLAFALIWGTLDCFIELSLRALALVIKLYRDFIRNCHYHWVSVFF